MAITKITDPSALPTSTDDYVAQNNHLNNHTLNLTPPFPVDFDNDDVLKGAIFNIGGDLFYTDSDTAITGTASDYVKLTPGTTTAVPTYETAANITANVSWNDVYNGYYDSSGNLYVFDEIRAYINETISSLFTDNGRQWHDSAGQDLTDTADVTHNDLELTGELARAVAGVTILANSTGVTESTLFSTLGAYIPNNGDKMIVEGFILEQGSSYDEIWFIHEIERNSSTTIYVNDVGLIRNTSGVVSLGAVLRSLSSTGSDTYEYNLRIVAV